MWADINGERKKVACGPCIRGHRSSKCDHKDRVLVEVRKPGRPLSSCPHPSGSCSCERVVINYTIPKTSECACPSERTQTISSLAGASSRVQKPRARKLTNSITPSSLEKAIKASQDIELDSSSLLASTPTNPSFAPSERSASNEASAPSSASSTPRILPSPSRKQSYSSDFRLSNASLSSDSRPATSNSEQISDCCKPKPEPVQQQGGSCCSNKTREPPKIVPAKRSCCSGSNQQNQPDIIAQNQQSNAGQNFGNFPLLQQQNQYFNAPYGVMSPGFNYNMSANMGTPIPFGFNTPIYNHMAGGYQQHAQLPNLPMHNGVHHAGTHSTEHNCHCGDGCSCFGCAAHPNNATMTEYIRVMHQYMSTGGFGAMPPPTYDMPSHPHHPGFGAEAAHTVNYSTNQSPVIPPVSIGQISFPAHTTPVMSIPDTPVDMSASWRQDTTPASNQTPPATDAQYFGPANNTQETPLSLKQEASAPSPATGFADSPADGKDEDTPTLSPSSYFWQELVLPGCNDATGTCQCGDGCECVGCLTHGGHNGVPLEAPATNGLEAFTHFLGDNTANGAGTCNYEEGPFTVPPFQSYAPPSDETSW
ncbi:hypothetical protein K505DRAFT_352564 [Melanomma pulvis-pyrius CBS 109.77]|uniref:Copper-fist domain-containing protein n=1 Tax=Melanomma pulvis-pyrius CBS 109.77 TaxID=1314802 RepID=A0A6A6WZ29_9PLEO|nr:hypothetical protein K505DRAFT_352564 [Melanomma pulvis-pyrius CBS 109.77]